MSLKKVGTAYQRQSKAPGDEYSTVHCFNCFFFFVFSLGFVFCEES